MKKAKEYREDAASLVKQCQDLVDKARTEKRELNDGELSQWNKMDDDAEKALKQAKVLEKQEIRNAEMAHASGNPVLSGNDGLEEDETEDREFLTEKELKKLSRKERDAFRTILDHGYNALTPDQRKIIRPAALEKRAQSTTSAAGGYTIPQGFGNQIIEFMKEFGGMREVAYVFATESGNLLPFPTNDDTANVGSLLTEVTGDSSSSVTDLTFGQSNLSAYTYTSGLIKISKQLIQDSYFDISEYVQKKLAIRLARIQNTHFTTGDGSSKPTGLITGASAGITAASATAITADEILDLQHSVDPSYRKMPGAGYMFHDSTLKAIKKLKDSQGRYIWQMGDITKGEPALLWNKPYTVNQDMAQIATGNKTIAFGDMKQYFIRDVMDMNFAVLNERYAEFFLVAVVGFMRSDGKLMNTSAVKVITQA